MSNSTLTDRNSRSLFNEVKEEMESSSEKALQLLAESQQLAEQEQDFEIMCEMLLYLSRHLRFQGKAFDSAEQLNQAYRLLNRHIPHDNRLLAHIYKEFGSLYSDGFQDFETALDYSLRSLRLNIDELRPPLYNNIGSQYISLKQYGKAFAYLTKGQRICREMKADFVLCFIYENFGNLFKEQERFSESIDYYQLGLEACQQAYHFTAHRQSIDYIKAYIQIGLAEVYSKLDQRQEMNLWIRKIYDAPEKLKNTGALSLAYLLEGQSLVKENRIVEFESLFHTSIEFCQQNSFYQDHKKWLQIIIQLYEEQGKFKNALTYSKKIIALREDKESKTKAVSLSKVLENKERQILNLENRNRKMQLQKEQLEQFAYIVAHDLKTPLSNISNFIGLFSKKYRNQVDAPNQFYLDFVLDNSKQLHKMLDDLLGYITLKEEEGKLPACDVEGLLSRFSKSHSEQIKQKNGRIEFGALPKVNIHHFHLEIILVNLIKNSLKFSRENVDAHIKVEVKENPREYLFEVADNGIGIQEEYHKKIFDVFKQLDKVNYKGTGMGLSICKKIIQIYGGKIWVSSNEWDGTSFHFNIPKKIEVE